MCLFLTTQHQLPKFQNSLGLSLPFPVLPCPPSDVLCSCTYLQTEGEMSRNSHLSGSVTRCSSAEDQVGEELEANGAPVQSSPHLRHVPPALETQAPLRSPDSKLLGNRSASFHYSISGCQLSLVTKKFLEKHQLSLFH